MRSSAGIFAALLVSACLGAVIFGQQAPNTFIISGRVVDPLQLRPAEAVLTLGRQHDNGSSSSGYVPLQTDGSFVTRPVQAGRYLLQVVRTPHSPTEAVVGFQSVTVTTADVQNVTVTVRRDTSLTGTFKMVTDNPATPWPSSIVVIAPFAFTGEGDWPSGRPAEGARGGKFILRNAFGPRVLRCGYRLDHGNYWWPQ